MRRSEKASAKTTVAQYRFCEGACRSLHKQGVKSKYTLLAITDARVKIQTEK